MAPVRLPGTPSSLQRVSGLALLLALVAVPWLGVCAQISVISPIEDSVVNQNLVTITGNATALDQPWLDSAEGLLEGTLGGLAYDESAQTITVDPKVGEFVKEPDPLTGTCNVTGGPNAINLVDSVVPLAGGGYVLYGTETDYALGLSASRLWTIDDTRTGVTGTVGSPITLGGIGTFDYIAINGIGVVRDGAAYGAYYGGINGINGRDQMGKATPTANNPSAATWNKAPSNPVMPYGLAVDWYGGGVDHPSIVENGAGDLEMWYNGKYAGTTSSWQVGYAISDDDGLTWDLQNLDKRGKVRPVVPFPAAGLGEDGLYGPEVVQDPDRDRMWFVGIKQMPNPNNQQTDFVINKQWVASGVGYLESRDATNWTPPEGEDAIAVVLEKDNDGSAWDDREVHAIALLKEGQEYLMYYTGEGTAPNPADGTRVCIGLAVAPQTDLEGNFTSQIWNPDYTVNWTSTDWEASAPAGSNLTVEGRSSNDSFTWTPWVGLEQGTRPDLPIGHFFQYRVHMASEDGTMLPTFSAFYLNYSAILKVEVSTNNATWEQASGQSPWSVQLLLNDGLNTIYLRATDTTPYLQYHKFDLLIDSVIPTGTVTINDGAPYTTSPAVMLTFTAADVYGVTLMRVSNSETSLASAPWLDFASSMAWALDSSNTTNGERWVYAQFQDSNGLVSQIVSDHIIYDTLPPVLSVQIADGAAYTPSVSVELDIQASDTSVVFEMRLAESDAALGAALWQPFSPRVSYLLSVGAEGGSTGVVVEVRDRAGLASKATDTITVDLQPPSGSVIIEGGRPVVASRTVNLTLSADDDYELTDMRLSTSPVFSGAKWELYATSRQLLLPPVNGPVTVYVQYRDAAGLVSESASDDIVVNTRALGGTLTIDGGEPVTANQNVTLGIALFNRLGSEKMRLANTPSFSGQQWEAYRGTKEWTLSDGDGLKTVFLQFQDQFGLDSPVVNASIVLDRTPPNITVTSPANPQGYHVKVSVTGFEGDSIDGESKVSLVEVRVDDNDWKESNSLDESGHWVFSLHRKDYAIGDHEITFRATDAAGNTQSISFDLVLDRTAGFGDGPDGQTIFPGFEGAPAIAALVLGGLITLARRRR